MDPLRAADQQYDIGRCLIFYRDEWDGTGAFFDEAAMAHIGDTNGAVRPEMNSVYNPLKVEELFGPAKLKNYFKGHDPVITVTVFPTPALLGVFSPTGLASAGVELQELARRYSLWIAPERLFIKRNETTGRNERVPITWVGGEFLKDGDALTVEEQALADMSMLIWSADLEQLPIMFSDENGGFAGSEVNINIHQNFIYPSGCQQYLIFSELALFPELDLEGFVS